MDLKFIAPLQLIVLGFAQPKFEARLLEEIARLDHNPLVRLVDAVAVEKSIEGRIDIIDICDLPKGSSVENGAVIGYLFGLKQSQNEAADEAALALAMYIDNEYEYGMDPYELETVTEDIAAGGIALMLLIEHVWALPLKQTARAAGGMLIAQDFLSPENLIGIEQQAFEAVRH